MSSFQWLDGKALRLGLQYVLNMIKNIENIENSLRLYYLHEYGIAA